MWLAFEMAGADYIEGSCPKNILFSNCKFMFDSEAGAHIEVYNASTIAERALKSDPSKQDAYFHVKDIVFYKCMSADKDADASVFQPGMDVAPFSGLCASGQ